MEINPQRITIEIATPCNLSCEMCFLDGFRRKKIYDAKKQNSFLSFELIKKIITDFSDNFSEIRKGPMALILSGGEPFLHPDIFNILHYAKEKNVGLTVFTNGTLIGHDFAKKIVEEETEALMFSLDGPQKIHDQIRGSGTFEKTFQAISQIQHHKRTLHSRKPKIFINSLINDSNSKNLDEIIMICEKLRVDRLFFSHIQWSNPKLSKIALSEIEKRLEWSEPLSKMIESMEHNLNVKSNNLETLLDKMSFIKNHHQNKHSFGIDFIPDLFDEEIRLWYSNNIYRLDSCHSIQKQLRIGVNGDVYPICAPIPFPLGNLKNNSLKEVLNNEKTKGFFDKIERDGLFFACQRCCRRDPESKCLQKKSLSLKKITTKAS